MKSGTFKMCKQKVQKITWIAHDVKKLACIGRKSARWFLVSMNLCCEKQISIQDLSKIDTVMWFVSIFKKANCCHSIYVLFFFKTKIILCLYLCFNNFLVCFFFTTRSDIIAEILLLFFRQRKHNDIRCFVLHWFWITLESSR